MQALKNDEKSIPPNVIVFPAFSSLYVVNKYVVVKYTAKNKYDKNNSKLMSVYYDCQKDVCKSYEDEVLKQGYAVVFSKSNIANELKQYEGMNKIKDYAKNTYFASYVKLYNSKAIYKLLQ